MKIGIINFHSAHNYGAMLQAYALQKTLQKEGNEVLIIDFQPDSIMNGYKLWSFYKLKHPKWLFKTIINYRTMKTKYNLFESFKKNYMSLTPGTYKEIKENDLESLNFDAVICGSDQVWNMDLNGNHTEYLLSFIQNKDTKKISYAASIGTNTINSKHLPIMKKYLNQFDCISVRERNAVDILNKEFNLKSQHVLDPVFLLSKEEWADIAKPTDVQGDYVLLYGLEENELFEKTFKFIKENTNLKIINVSPMKKQSPYIDETLYNVGPREFLGLLIKANLVFTNSFHGTCFSIIFGKKFFAIGHSELNSRLESILAVTQLEHHMINKELSSLEELDEILTFDVEKVNNILTSEIENSKNYLFKSLK